MAREEPDYRLVIFLIGLTQLIITIDFSIVTVALPSIERQVRLSPSSLSWVISAGALAGGGLLILAGRAADMFGQRLCMLVGLTLFGAGSLGAALSPNLPVLIAARIMQGVGGAVLGPANFSLVNTVLPEGAHRRRAMSVFGLMQGLSLVIGLLIGGALTTQFGWRSVFLLNPPIAALAIALTLMAAPKPVRIPGLDRRIDWLGAALITLGIGLVLLGVSTLGRQGFTARPLAMLAGGVAAFVVFFIVEGRVGAPLAPLSLFRRRNFTPANIIFLLLLAVVAGVFVLVNLYMQTVLKMSAMQSGLGMMPYAAAVMISGQSLAPIMARLPNRLIVCLGFVSFLLGVALFAVFSAQRDYWLAIVPGSAAMGFGATIAFMALLADATSDVPAQQQGAASAMLFTAQAIGGPLGPTLSLAVLAMAGMAAGPAAFGGAYLTLAGMVAVALLISVLTLRPLPPPEPRGADLMQPVGS